MASNFYFKDTFKIQQTPNKALGNLLVSGTTTMHSLLLSSKAKTTQVANFGKVHTIVSLLTSHGLMSYEQCWHNLGFSWGFSSFLNFSRKPFTSNSMPKSYYDFA